MQKIGIAEPKFQLVILMNDKQKEKWAQTREKGLLGFIFINGVLMLGIPAAIASNITTYIYANGFTLSKIEVLFTEDNIFWFIFQAIITGLLVGYLIWSSAENSFKKLIKNNSIKKDPF